MALCRFAEKCRDTREKRIVKKGDCFMKVAVSSSGQDFNSLIDPRFGRCAYFLVVETQDMSFEVFENQSAALGGGAGIQAAQFVISKEAKAIITGNCGPNAVKTLSAAGLKVFLQVTGTIKEAVENYKNGNLIPSDQANVAEHSGLREKSKVASEQQQVPVGGAGSGRGMGQGRGMKMGGRRGMGSGMGMGRGNRRA